MLTDQSGQEFLFGQPDLLNQPGHNNKQWFLVEFIYTRCPDVCYAMGSAFQQIQRQLKEKNLDDKVQLLSISFDPENDQRALLANYASRFQADIQNWKVTRPVQKSQLPRLLEQFGIVVIPDKFGGYQHNAAIHVVDGQGMLVGIFDYQAPDKVIEELWARLSHTQI
jgi:protein SCO1/2